MRLLPWLSGKLGSLDVQKQNSEIDRCAGLYFEDVDLRL